MQFLTLVCSIAPNKVTRFCILRFSRISSRRVRFGPSPAITKLTFSTCSMRANTPAIKSTPFRYTKRDTTTTITRNVTKWKQLDIFQFITLKIKRLVAKNELWFRSFGLCIGCGVKNAVSTAFGITDTFSFGTFARKTVFSLPVCDTQIQWFTVDSVISSNLFVTTADKSAKPNKL